MEVAFEKREYKVADRKIQLIVEDEEGKPDIALMKTRKLVEKDKVEVIFGPISSASGYAMREYLRAAKVPLMMNCAAAGGLTRENMSPYCFRIFHGAGIYYSAKWAYEKMGCRKAMFMGLDYAYGRELGEGFLKGFKRAGGTIVGEFYTAVGTKDYGPYLLKIAKLAEDTGADCLGITYAGTDGIAVVKQIEEYGIKGKFRVIVAWSSMNYGVTLDGQGKAGIGLYDTNPYFYGDDSPANKEFVKLFEKKFGKLEATSAQGYLSVDVICRALETVRGNIEDKDRFLEAIRNVKYDSVYGPFEFDLRDQNMRQNYKILRNEMVGNKVGQVVVYEFPKAEDWWWLEKK
jgi:branched-chain amino acid transport system substrate-binding protein